MESTLAMPPALGGVPHDDCKATERTPVVEQSLGAPDFTGIATFAEAMQKLNPSGQLLIGAVVFAAIAAVLGGVGSVAGR